MAKGMAKINKISENGARQNISKRKRRREIMYRMKRINIVIKAK